MEQTILLVDHDLDFLEWATKHLAAPGLRILRCDHPEKAVKIFDKTAIDLVISEIRLEPFDGLELIQRVRAKHPATIFVLVTGFPSTNQIIEATQRGAQDVLRKESVSFDFRHVVETLLQTIDDRRSAGEQPAEMPITEDRVKMIGISRSLQEVFKIVGRACAHISSVDQVFRGASA